jgi:hypothetical protein
MGLQHPFRIRKRGIDMSTPTAHVRPAGPARRLGIFAALVLSTALIGCAATAPDQDPPDDAEASTITSGEELAAGTYRVDVFSVPFEITVPAGWTYSYDLGLLEAQDVFLKFNDAAFVPLDACQWVTPLVEVGPSVDDMADALVQAESTATSTPVDVDVSGYTGVEFDLAIEDDVEMSECRDAHVCIHSESAGYCTRYYHEGVGQRETYRILDLDGERALLTVGQWAEDADPQMIEEARAVYDSLTFVDE